MQSNTPPPRAVLGVLKFYISLNGWTTIFFICCFEFLLFLFNELSLALLLRYSGILDFLLVYIGWRDGGGKRRGLYY